MARRVQQVARQSQKIRGMQPAEQITLMFEGNLHKISQKLSAPDMRDQPFDKQLENILATVSAQHADREFITENSKKQQGEIKELRQQIANGTSHCVPPLPGRFSVGDQDGAEVALPPLA